MFIRFDRIHECDEQKDRRTPRGAIGHSYASHGMAFFAIIGLD